MIYGSVCSGIEAASVAWEPLGWKAAFFSEIEAFPRAVLAHRWPGVKCHGDFTTIQAGQYDAIDVLVGGTPCQSFSVAGLRGGMADERGNLALEYLRLVGRLRPRWIVYENVPGILSSNGGRDFGSFLGGLVQLGYGFAYRVLDAAYFGLAQRRARVFVVGHFGNDWHRCAAVLSIPEGLRGHPAPRREAGKAVAALTANGVGTCGADDNQAQAGHLIATTLRARDGARGVDSNCTDTLIVQPYTLAMRGRDGGSDLEYRQDGTANALLMPGGGRGGCGVGAIAFSCKDYGADAGHLAPTLRAMSHSESHANGGGQVAVAFNGQMGAMASGSQVRRITPVEAARLQGFPEDYLDITYRGKPAADGNKYRALGNSFAVPVVAWIGKRIALVDA